jgi:hypothetical protein
MKGDRLTQFVGACKIARCLAAVFLAALAGCSSLPTIVPDMATRPTRPIQLEGAQTLLVILGPLGGTDFTQSISHPRTGQPDWYRRLDLPVETAASLIVQAMQRGRSQLVAPWWYRIIFVLARIFSPLVGMFGKKVR